MRNLIARMRIRAWFGSGWIALLLVGLVPREICSPITETDCDEGEGERERELDVLHTARADLLSTCRSVGDMLIPILERYKGPKWAEDRERRERLGGEFAYISACLAGLTLSPDEIPPTYTPSLEMVHEVSVLKLTRRLCELRDTPKKPRAKRKRGQSQVDPNTNAFWHCLFMLKECPMLSPPDAEYRSVALDVPESTQHSLYQSYRGRMTQLYHSTTDPKWEWKLDVALEDVVPRKTLVGEEACVVGIGEGRVMCIQRSHCRIVEVCGFSPIKGLYIIGEEDLGTVIGHPLSLVEIPGVYNRWSKTGAEGLQRGSRPQIGNRTHAALFFGGCVYYITRVELDQYDGCWSNFTPRGISVFECPIDTMEWREIGTGSREKGEWFPESYAYTENVRAVGDTVVCEMVNAEQRLWAFDPQHGDGTDINVRPWTQGYPLGMTPHQEHGAKSVYSGTVQLGSYLFRVRLKGEYIAHLLAMDTVTQREEVWAEIDRKLTSPYYTPTVGVEREDWHRSHVNKDWKPILASLSRESMYCIVGEPTRECQDMGYVIRLSERALEEVYGQ
ncbi:hypothetical protein KIPB_004709 [Kipferlia bialata]|uniref:Uncharacterized protein n=1 Tax=Kipferlia bialata TaxID=797122 RepID=A0A9K3CWD6_9EUKA|nr:hypothetical protein KIPB_004709 [Kipferlia bialata]|eukprot:g4709.t1